MITPDSIDRDRILLRLDTFRFVEEANIDLLENNPALKEQLDQSIATVQGYLKELDVHEKSGDSIHYACALDSAEMALQHVYELIKTILQQ